MLVNNDDDYYYKKTIKLDNIEHSVAEWVDLFIISIYPKIDIIQLPGFYIEMIDLSYALLKNNIDFYYSANISETELEENSYKFNCSSVIILKFTNNYLYVYTDMIELLKIANDVHRVSKLKCFW